MATSWTGERSAEHVGRLTPIRRVVSDEVVLPPHLLELSRDVAGAGPAPCPTSCAWPCHRVTPPPRSRAGRPTPPAPERPDPGVWSHYSAGPAFLDRLAAGDPVRAAWLALPGADWPEAIARAVGTTAASGRGALVVAAGRIATSTGSSARSGSSLGADQHVRLTADQGPAARYAAWLEVLRGQTRIVVGTRSAALAPVADLGLVVCWDDGDDLHAEPHAPYWHAREVLALRADRERAAALLGGFVRTAEVQRLVDQGWARPVGPTRSQVRTRAPRVLARRRGRRAVPRPGGQQRAAGVSGVAHGPRRPGTRPGAGPGAAVGLPARAGLRSDCRAPARCRLCHGPLGIGERGGPPICRWCGRADAAWSCPACEGTHLRSSVVGSRRTAEELGRAFPGVPVRVSGGQHVLAEVPGTPALVVATPGAEPVAEDGYAAVLLLDGWALLGRPDLRAGEEALRRWSAAAALARPASAGGAVVLAAPSGVPPVEALVRWDPVWHRRAGAGRAGRAAPSRRPCAPPR